MPLGRVTMVTWPPRKRETVMGAGIDFDFGIGPMVFHSVFQLFDDFRRRVDIGFSAGEIQFSPGFLHRQMRAVRLFGGQMRSVDGGGGPDAFRSEERRVGKEWRALWWRGQCRK